MGFSVFFYKNMGEWSDCENYRAYKQMDINVSSKRVDGDGM